MTEKIDFYNPFRAYRTEQLESLWKFYVSEPFDNYLGPKPLVFEGGRGSGKTMFLKCNSWEQKFKEKGESHEGLRSLLQSNSLVGFYYRVDGTFIGSFYGKDVKDEVWESVFSTYFNIVICKEILFFVKQCIGKEIVKEEQLIKFFDLISSKFCVKENCSNSVTACIENLNTALDQIEYFVNGTKEALPSLLVPGRLIKLVIEELRSLEVFKDSRFHIFIDEYETLSKNQQIQINTLIKMSEYWLVYDIAVKHKGIKSDATLNGQIIRSPHDYKYFKPEAEIDEDAYKALLRKICEKRFQQFINIDAKHQISSDICFYLGEYSRENELSKINAKINIQDLKLRIKEIINNRTNDVQKQSKYFEELTNCDLINIRLNLCLLLREGEDFTPENIYAESVKNRTGQSAKYKHWIHNMSFSIIFLLANEAKVRKEYYGFSVYAMLSSGVVRYFLELCEHAFDFAHSNGFTFENPRPLSSEEQSKAARYVSRYKIGDIEWLKPYGKKLNRFILILGSIFNELHSNVNLTLGEPEHNHFYSKVDELDQTTIDLLDAALTHNILQQRLPTKEKEGDLSIETQDYFLNYIYCPYFEISYRRKRKLYIAPTELIDLLNGDATTAKKARKQIFSRHKAILIEEKKVSIDKQISFLGEE